MAIRINIICLLLLIWSCSYSQAVKTVAVTDISNKESVNVFVKEDWGNSRICLTNQGQKTDTLEIAEAVEIDTIDVKLNSFIEVVYKIRGGSGEHIRATKVFCVANGQLKESLSILTFEDSFSLNGKLQESYRVKIELQYKNAKYIASLTEKSNKAVKKVIQVVFDKATGVFFSGKKVLSKVNICGQKNNGVMPHYQIALSLNTYIYIILVLGISVVGNAI